MAIKRTTVAPQTPAAGNKENAPAAAAPKLQDTSVAAQAQSEPETDDTDTGPAEPVQVAAPLPATSNGQGTALANAGQMPDDGFNQLDSKLGFGSFDILKLDKSNFMVGNKDVGTSVFVQMMGGRAKFLYKEKGKQDTTNLFYSYDRLKTASGESVEAILKEWTSKGIEYEDKEYAEVVAKLLTVDKASGQYIPGKIVLLSIPPASVNRLGGYRFEIVKMKGLKISEVVTKCTAGDTIKISASINFKPWEFEFVTQM